MSLIIGQSDDFVLKKKDDIRMWYLKIGQSETMNKSGVVYRHVAELYLRDSSIKPVVRHIASDLGISPNTVSMALSQLSRIGAIKMHKRNFEILDFGKLLVFWEVNRKFDKDIVYRTYVRIKDPNDIEKYMPNEIAYTNYSGYIKLFGNDASDYGSVYVYATDKSMEEIKKRFPPKSLSSKVEWYNLYVMKPDYELARMIENHELKNSTVPISQLYVDLWNNGEWYAFEFLKKLKNRMGEMYGKTILE
jgi:hypothetical protein